MSDKPDVYELNGTSFEKQESKDCDEEERDDEEYDDEDEKNVPDSQDPDYPDDVIDELEQETDVEMPEDYSAKSDDETKELVGNLELNHKIDKETDFASLKSGDTVLIDTPLEGAKVGKVTDLEEAWTGTLQAKVDTGANEYVVTPFDDEYNTSFVGEVDEKMDLKQDVLGLLARKTTSAIKEGDDVVLDVPEIGPTRAVVEDVVETDNQGKRATLKSGDVHFVVYEEPTPTQTKEQAFIVGEFK